MGHSVDSIDHKHDLGLLLEFAVPERIFPTINVVQATLKAVFPELSEPGVTCVVVRIEVCEVRCEFRDRIGRQLNGESSIRYILTPSHHTLLRPPAIAGHPDEGDVHALRCNQELSCVFTSGEEDYYFSVGLLQQRSDYSIVTEAVHGTTDLGGRSDADLQGSGLLLKGVDTRLAVIAL